MKPIAFVFAIVMLAGASAAHAQFGGVVFDPTQSGHAIQQIAEARQLYSTTVQTTENVIAAYNLAKQMASSPTSLYRPYLSPSTYWMAIDRGRQHLRQLSSRYRDRQYRQQRSDRLSICQRAPHGRVARL